LEKGELVDAVSDVACNLEDSEMI